MSMDRDGETRRLEATVEESQAELAHLMARYDVVVVRAAVECPEPGPTAVEDYGAADAIMRYYNG